jgi:16S rRNA (guanine966-N2)-methyltransferase
LRVIAGDAHGRRLTSPRGHGTRPATARVRASIFSRIAARRALDGARVLDLFAGSGSLGLEALSRGAAEVVFVDSSSAAAAAITHNLRALNLISRGRIITMDFRRALAHLTADARPFDLIFIDAPYANDVSTEVLAKLAQMDLIAPLGFVVVRQFHRAPTPLASEVECVNIATLGDHRIALYRRSESGAAMTETSAHK